MLTDISHVGRNRRWYAFFKKILPPFFNKNVRFEPYTPKNNVYIVLSNHNSDSDPLYQASFFPDYMRFVASEHLFRKGLLSRLLVYLVNPIPRKKGTKGDETIEDIKNTLSNGICVALYAEGNRSWNGETGFISPRTGQLVKDSKSAMITFRFDGGYLISPRWSDKKRRGTLYAHVVREYSADELGNMSADEINSVIARDLYTNVFEQQRDNPVRYKGHNLAEHLENALYICPECKKFGTLHSRRNDFFCDCGYTVRLNDFGFFEGDKIIFDNILEWDKWQRNFIKDNIGTLASQTEIPISSDFRQSLYLAKEGKPLLCRGSMSVYGDRIEFKGKDKAFVWKLSEIDGIAVTHSTTMFLNSRGKYYEIKSKIPRSAVKYIALWRILTGKEYL